MVRGRGGRFVNPVLGRSKRAVGGCIARVAMQALFAKSLYFVGLDQNGVYVFRMAHP